MQLPYDIFGIPLQNCSGSSQLKYNTIMPDEAEAATRDNVAIDECYPTIISSTISAFFAWLIPPEEFLASSPSEVVVVDIAQIRQRWRRNWRLVVYRRRLRQRSLQSSDVKKDVVNRRRVVAMESTMVVEETTKIQWRIGLGEKPEAKLDEPHHC
ncbi:unnamed protein product [Prunus brigantina]